MLHKRSEAKEYARKNFRGVWAAIPTPFDAKGEIDEKAIRSDIRHYIDQLRIDGFFFGGLVGESWSLTYAERIRLQEMVLDEVGDGCQTIAHTAAMSIRETVALSQHAQEHGADYIVALQPPVSSSRPENVVSFFEHVCSEIDLGLTLFNNKVAGYSLSPDLVNRLADIENVIGIKDAQPIEHIEETRKLCGDRIIICDPNEGRFCENILTHGDKLFMSSPAPFLLQTPDSLTIRNYTELAWAGKADEARKLSATLEPGRALMAKWILGGGGIQENSAAIKYWAELLGMSGGSPRSPLFDLTDQQKAEMRGDLEQAGILIRQAAE